MNQYEKLTYEACKDGMDVYEQNFRSQRIKGLYCDGVACINRNLTEVEKTCALSEEYGHHITSYGDIINLSDVQNAKQELRARMWAYNRQIGLLGIIKSYEYGCRNLYDMAEYLEVTEEFLKDALERYRQKYGMYTVVDNYIIYFEPGLGVVKMN